MAARTTASHKKKAAACRGVVVFEDEASFWQDGTLHRTWSRVGVQPRVDAYGMRKTAHVYGAVSLDEALVHLNLLRRLTDIPFTCFSSNLFVDTEKSSCIAYRHTHQSSCTSATSIYERHSLISNSGAP